MTTTPVNANETPPATPQMPQFAIQRLYIKDISFETPNTPQIFKQAWQPDINLQFNNKVATLEPAIYEVTLSITLTAKLGEQTAYLVEIHQSGIFFIKDFSPNDLQNMLNGYCPNILFPYAREAISDLVTRGGFPPMILAPMNFEAIYAQHRLQQQQPVHPA